MVPREIDATAFEDRPFRFYVRDIAAISPRDLQQLSVESVDAVSIEGQSGGVRPAHSRPAVRFYWLVGLFRPAPSVTPPGI